MRIEEDCIGKLAVDEDVLYGIHTTRALANFPISHERTDPLLFKSLIIIKKAAAQVNAAAGTLTASKAKAIAAACNSLLMGEHNDALVAPAIQGSAGTSVNMNVNEVIANLASVTRPTGCILMMTSISASRRMTLIRQPGKWRLCKHCRRCSRR